MDTNTTSQPSGATFFSLPRELRDQIYDEYIKSSASIPESFASQLGKPYYDQKRFEDTVTCLVSAVPCIQNELIERFYALNNDIYLQFHTLAQIRRFLTNEVFCPPRFHKTLCGRWRLLWSTSKPYFEGRQLAQKLLYPMEDIDSRIGHELSATEDALTAGRLLDCLELDVDVKHRGVTINSTQGGCCDHAVKLQGSGWHFNFAYSCDERYMLVEGNIGICGLFRREV